MSSRDRGNDVSGMKKRVCLKTLFDDMVSDSELESYFNEQKKRAEELSKDRKRSSTHGGICKELHSTYLKKNRDYGDAFGNSLDKFGIVAAVTRMSDKMSRIETLYESVGASRSVTDESIEDTLLDLANYAIMTVMWLRDRDEEVTDNEVAFYADNQKYFTSNCNRPFKSTYEAENNTMLKELRDSVEKLTPEDIGVEKEVGKLIGYSEAPLTPDESRNLLRAVVEDDINGGRNVYKR